MPTESLLSDGRILSLLGKLGIASEDSQLYLSILLQSGEPPGGLRVGRQINPSDAGIGRLCDLGLVFLSQAPDGETIAVAFDPRLASRALYTRYLWTLCPDEMNLDQLQPAALHRLDAFHSLCAELEATLASQYRQPPPEQGVILVRGDMISQKLAAVLACAQTTICGITAPLWAPRLDLVWETLKERMSAGVRYRRLSDESTFVAFGHEINVRDTEAYNVELRILPRSQIKEKFFLCDGRCAFTFWPARPGIGFPLEASVTYLNVLVRSCEQTFDRMWDKAVAGSQAIEVMESFRERFVQECMDQHSCDSMAELANGIFDWGKFFFDDCTPEEKDSFKLDLDLLLAARLVVPSPDCPAAVIPNLIDEFREAMQLEA